jgi:hypothetical protein
MAATNARKHTCVLKNIHDIHESSIDFNTDNALSCSSGIISVEVNTTVPWAIYKS